MCYRHAERLTDKQTVSESNQSINIYLSSYIFTSIHLSIYVYPIYISGTAPPGEEGTLVGSLHLPAMLSQPCIVTTKVSYTMLYLTPIRNKNGNVHKSKALKSKLN